ncbi:hypothetical protein [Nocardia farcinica]|uniref:hypothetical protein n=1 Tax=Nocardia farcinica TaxID=37329 RepID=UPI00245445B2|nr:hypothetical protein [Nocardia farcinica]
MATALTVVTGGTNPLNEPLLIRFVGGIVVVVDAAAGTWAGSRPVDSSWVGTSTIALTPP